MTQLSDFIKHATDPEHSLDKGAIFACAAAHVWLAQIHPFTDGNGRTARALMNLLLMRRGYPPCIITEEDRPRYIDALEGSWENGDLTALMELIYENVNEHRKNRDWLRSVQARLQQVVSNDVEHEYSVWRNAMTYLKSQFRHTVDNLNAINMHNWLQIRFIDYGDLGTAKYDALRSGMPASKTRYFGIEVVGPAQRHHYVFFHGIANENLREHAHVALTVVKGMAPEDLQLDTVAPAAIPENYQFGFDMEAREFIVSLGEDLRRQQDAQSIAQQFFDVLLPSGLES